MDRMCVLLLMVLVESAPVLRVGGAGGGQGVKINNYYKKTNEKSGVGGALLNCQ